MDNIVETDACCVPSRNSVQAVPQVVLYERVAVDQVDEAVESKMQERNPQRILPIIPDPPSDWKFNCLLDEIAQEVDDVQLERFKELFRGHEKYSIGKGTLERCKSCLQFFNLLKERLYLSKDNLLYLQKFLFMLDNKELIEKMIDYCRTENRFYFYKVEEIEGSGCRSVKFHVRGGDVSLLEQHLQQKIRNLVADIMCVPREHIRIIGVESVASLCVTLLIPVTYADIFESMLANAKEFKELSNLNVDFIYISQRIFNISGSKEVDEGELRRLFLNINDQYRDDSLSLEKTKSQNSELQEDLKELNRTKKMLADEKAVTSKTTVSESAQHEDKANSIIKDKTSKKLVEPINNSKSSKTKTGSSAKIRQCNQCDDAKTGREKIFEVDHNQKAGNNHLIKHSSTVLVH